MKKDVLITIMALLIFCFATTANAQEETMENEGKTSNMEMFISKAGIIIKTRDYNMPSIPTMYTMTNAETCIRVLKSGNVERYFYLIEMQGKNGTSTASIEYSDLLEIKKAIGTLKAEENVDVLNKPDYLENRIISSDGFFQVGYRVKNGRFESGKSTWYISWGRILSSEVVLRSIEDFEQALEDALKKMDELKTLTKRE